MKESADPRDVGRIVRKLRTSEYWSGKAWTDDRKQALLFPNEEEAMRACASYQLSDVEIIWYAPGSGITNEVPQSND